VKEDLPDLKTALATTKAMALETGKGVIQSDTVQEIVETAKEKFQEGKDKAKEIFKFALRSYFQFVFVVLIRNALSSKENLELAKDVAKAGKAIAMEAMSQAQTVISEMDAAEMAALAKSAAHKVKKEIKKEVSIQLNRGSPLFPNISY